MTKLSKAEQTLNAKLFVRIIPTTDINFDLINIDEHKKVLYVRCLQDLAKNVNVKEPHYWAFYTDGIFWNLSQSKIYETITDELYEPIFDGVNAIILSYGQTGSGKTTTSSGLRFQFQNRGFALRILSQLFEEVKKRSDFNKINLGMSYLEFCGENIKDLLSNKLINNVKDVPEYVIQDEEWAWHQVFNAECRKSYVEDAPYKGSNKCSSVLTFYVHSESLVDTDPIASHSKIHLVDVAGYGNFGDESFAWKSKTDLANSNLTKSFMDQLIICLTERAKCSDQCPYKSSRFLLYLNDALNPKSLIRFVAHVFGNFNNLALTISTLKFGVKIRDLKPTKLERFVEFNYGLHMKNLEKECQLMKDEIILSSMLQDTSDFGNISQERYQQIRRAAEDYLAGELDSLTLVTLGQTNVTLDAFKDLYQKVQNEKEQMMKDALATAKEMLQSRTTMDKAGSVSTLPSHRASKKKSRQQDSQNFGHSNRSGDFGPISSSTVLGSPQQVGYFDKKGISIGTAKTTSTTEGNITKAYKKLRSKKSDGILNKGSRKISAKDYGLKSKIVVEENPQEISLPTEVPNRESAWQNFVQESLDLVTLLSANVEAAEKAAAEAKQKYLNTLAELSRAKAEIEVIEADFENCQHLYRICCKGEFDENGNLLPGEAEKELLNLLSEKRKQLNVLTENCQVALIDLKTFVEKVNEEKRVLENSFQEYCQMNYKIVYPDEETFISDPVKLYLPEEENEFCGERDLDIENMKSLFYFLQQKLLEYVPPPKKREWKNY